MAAVINVNSKPQSDIIEKQNIADKFNIIAHDDGNVCAKIDTLFIGDSLIAQNIKQMIQLASTSHCPIIITGPSGSGKEVAAKAIHSLSARRSKPLVSINCGAIPHELIEAELFGHSKGSFTGAHKDHIGLFEQANGGTLFLDEIGEMPLNLQVRLLRVLEDGAVRRIGGQERIMDVRIIAATNREIGHAIGCGEFREDLYYRLSVLSIAMPTLKERCEDVPLLARHFIAMENCENPIKLSKSAWNVLQKHSWPGNVRELRNFVSRASLFNLDEIIDDRRAQTLLSMGIAGGMNMPINANRKTVDIADNIDLGRSFNLREHLMNEENKYVHRALQSANGNVSRAARTLGIKRTTLVEKLKRAESNNICDDA